MSVRAKFTVRDVKDYPVSAEDEVMASVTLSAVTEVEPDNEGFWKYTPSGTITIGITNPSAAEQFTVGKTFYVDFTDADG